jgi:hypothetical protein
MATHLTAADWHDYTASAREVAFNAEELWGELAPQEIDRDDHVRQVAYTLRIGLLTHYHASLDALNHPLTALAAETLVRSELEAFAHLAWLAHGEPLSNRTKDAWRKHCHSDNRWRWSSPVTRALCWRLGDARNYHKNLLRANPSVKDSRATTAARRQLRRIKTLHDATGCKGRDGRDYSDVQPMLTRLARRTRIWWLPNLWRAYSATAHQGSPIRLRAVAGLRTLQNGGPMSDRNRRDLLSRTLVVFLNAYFYVVTLSAGTEAGTRYHQEVGQAGLTIIRELARLNLT